MATYVEEVVDLQPDERMRYYAWVDNEVKEKKCKIGEVHFDSREGDGGYLKFSQNETPGDIIEQFLDGTVHQGAIVYGRMTDFVFALGPGFFYAVPV
jgi:hypothetical protein